MTLTIFLALSLLVAASAFVQGAVGIGFTLIMAPIFGFVDATYLPVTLLVLMLPLNALVAGGSGTQLTGRGQDESPLAASSAPSWAWRC